MKLTIPSLKVIAIPLAIFLVVIILFVFGSRFIWGKISQLRSEITVEKRNEQILQEKVSLLTNSQAVVSGAATNLVVALPEKNSSLSVISQIKSLAGQLSLVMADLKVGPEVLGQKAGLSRAEVKFELEGPESAAASFLNQISQTSPITHMQTVRINESLGLTRVTVTLSAFWTAFPEKLPPVNQALPPLTGEEEAMISEINALKPPAFVEVTPSAPVVRPNPFSPSPQ